MFRFSFQIRLCRLGAAFLLFLSLGLLYPFSSILGADTESAGDDSSFTSTGIPELDALIVGQNPGYFEGEECCDPGQEDDPDCDKCPWFRSVTFTATPVSARMISVIEHYSAASAGGAYYHYHADRFIWGVREGRVLDFTELVTDAECLSVRPGDDYPLRQDIYDMIKNFEEDAVLASVFEPTPEGFALWIDWSGLNGPREREFPLFVLEFCGVRKEYWEQPEIRH